MDLRGAETGMERERSPETVGQSKDFNCSEEITEVSRREGMDF